MDHQQQGDLRLTPLARRIVMYQQNDLDRPVYLLNHGEMFQPRPESRPRLIGVRRGVDRYQARLCGDGADITDRAPAPGRKFVVTGYDTRCALFCRAFESHRAAELCARRTDFLRRIRWYALSANVETERMDPAVKTRWCAPSCTVAEMSDRDFRSMHAFLGDTQPRRVQD